MLDFILTSICVLLSLFLGLFLGYYKCVKDLDNYNFEKRWYDCE